jgi:phosphonate transport system substrate-binding protein
VKHALLVGCALLALAASAAAGEKPVVTLGFNPAENADAIETNGRRFADYYRQATGFEVKTFVATDYTALTEALRSGRVDFAFLPAFSFLQAEKVAHAKALMKAVRHGRSFLYGAIIVRADKGYDTIEDLKGKNIAWVDPASSSGYVVPKAALIRRKKIDPDVFFHKQVFAGGHDAVVLSVLNGTVDAGATFMNDQEGKDGAWQLFLKNPKDQKKLKMIFRSGPIPSDTLATSGKFLKAHKEIVEKTVKALAGMSKNAQGRAILTDLYGIDAMVPATDKEYQPLKEAAELIGIQ